MVTLGFLEIFFGILRYMKVWKLYAFLLIQREISKMMAEKRLFNTDEAVQFVVERDSDSNLSDLSDDDDQDILRKNIPARIRDEQEESNDVEKSAENSFTDESENENEDEDEDNENENVVNAKT